MACSQALSRLYLRAQPVALLVASMAEGKEMEMIMASMAMTALMVEGMTMGLMVTRLRMEEEEEEKTEMGMGMMMDLMETKV